MRDLAAIVKAYDIRGVVPDQLDEDTARVLGAAFVEVLQARRIVTAHDMRPSSVPLATAFAQGATSRGADVVEAGLASTDLLYFASGSLGLPGAMFTASHNPARYNGIKLCRAAASPIGQDTGLAEIRERAEQLAATAPGPGPAGAVSQRDLLGDYAAYLLGLVDVSRVRPLTVVVDAGNGMAGLTVPRVLSAPALTVVPLFFELDGNFPNHEANPIDPANLRDLQSAVRAHGADLGLAFDGDADRCFVVDERGELVSPSVLTALIAERELGREPGATVIYNLITSHAVPELVGRLGGVAVRTRVGHSFIKAEMARTGAIFGGEHSGHFYFRDFWRADSGMLAALHVIAALGGQELPLSAVLSGYARYTASGEINSEVADVSAVLDAVERRFAPRAADLDWMDGMTVELGPAGWFNLRASNTEPLLRLNVEGPDPAAMEALRDEVLAVVRGKVDR